MSNSCFRNLFLVICIAVLVFLSLGQWVEAQAQPIRAQPIRVWVVELDRDFHNPEGHIVHQAILSCPIGQEVTTNWTDGDTLSFTFNKNGYSSRFQSGSRSSSGSGGYPKNQDLSPTMGPIFVRNFFNGGYSGSDGDIQFPKLVIVWPYAPQGVSLKNIYGRLGETVKKELGKNRLSRFYVRYEMLTLAFMGAPNAKKLAQAFQSQKSPPDWLQVVKLFLGTWDGENTNRIEASIASKLLRHPDIEIRSFAVSSFVGGVGRSYGEGKYLLRNTAGMDGYTYEAQQILDVAQTRIDSERAKIRTAVTIGILILALIIGPGVFLVWKARGKGMTTGLKVYIGVVGSFVLLALVGACLSFGLFLSVSSAPMAPPAIVAPPGAPTGTPAVPKTPKTPKKPMDTVEEWFRK